MRRSVAASEAPRLESPSDPSANSRARVLSDPPAIGGRIKERAEDFFVEEIPLSEPSGSGEYLHICLEKIGMSTTETVDLLSSHFGVARGEISYAGMKDKQAVTRQTLSVHGPFLDPKKADSIRDERVRVMWADRHDEPLKRGKLAGNRFAIKVRGVEATAALRANRGLSELERRGAPNRFGVQRFGARANNHEVGRRLLLGDHEGAIDHIVAPYAGDERLADFPAREMYAKGDLAGAARKMPRQSRAERRVLEALVDGASAEEAIDWVDETQRRFWMSSVQSAVFNHVLEARVRAQTFDTLLEGDVALRHVKDRSGREPIGVDAELLAEPGLGERVEGFELSASGPMWGPGMARASGAVDEAEVKALAALGLTLGDLERYDAIHGDDLIRGSRRELRVPVRECEVEGGVDEHGSYVLCAFALPSGAFATVVMDEIMRAGGENE